MEPINPSQKEELVFPISYFRNLWSKESTMFTLHQFYLETISPRWKPLTECYRRLKNLPDRKKEADDIKRTLSAVIIEGVCRPHHSHATANLETLSGLAMFDLDHLNERTATVKDLFRHLPYVTYMHTSISGEGLKVVVHLAITTKQEYPLAYDICRQTLEQIAQHPCDSQCACISQPCSCVYDPNAYYNPAPEIYPWREELAANPSLATRIQPQSNGLTGASSHYTYLSDNSHGKASPFPPATAACGYIEAFLRTFAHYHPWQKGNRHTSMLALGREARRKGFSTEELDKLAAVVAPEILGNGYTERELRKDLSAGYQYVNLSYVPENNEMLPPLPPTATLLPPSHEDVAEDEEQVSIKNEEARASTPCIPEEAYTHLPDFLNQALHPARNPRERDILLLGIITNLSGCMPQVRITFDQRPHSPHLYLLIIAPPASGKGLLTLAGMLPESINNYLKGENKRKKEAYERELKAREQAAHQGKKGTQPANSTSSPMPEEPDYYYLCGAPNTSRNQIIARLQTNGDLGLIINATELDMISGALKQDYGKHDDVFRAAFHHEPVATDYKVDKQIIRAETPRLALCLSGTPNQLPAFIRSMDNGLYCRFGSYTCEARWKYRSAAPIRGQEDYVTLYKRLSQKVLDMYLFLQQSPTEVTLTDRQWEEHTAYFERLLNEVASEQAEAPGAIVLRGALMVVRTASVLTALRKCECAMQMKEYVCTDDDFHTAMRIVQTTLSHSLLLASSLPGDELKPRPLKSYFRMRPVIKTLPNSFTYKEAILRAQKEGIGERSACRYLTNLSKLKYLDKQEDRYVKIKRLTDR